MYAYVYAVNPSYDDTTAEHFKPMDIELSRITGFCTNIYIQLHKEIKYSEHRNYPYTVV